MTKLVRLATVPYAVPPSNPLTFFAFVIGEESVRTCSPQPRLPDRIYVCGAVSSLPTTINIWSQIRFARCFR
jgi:hypothetical protein